MELDIKYYLEVKNIISFTTVKSLKSVIACIIFHNYSTIKVYSYNSLPLGKAITLCNVVILVKFGVKIKIIITIIYF